MANEEALEESNLWDIINKSDEYYQQLLMLEEMCRNIYPAIRIFNRSAILEHPKEFPGELIDNYWSKSGLIVYRFEYMILIGVGDRAHAEYGNRDRITATIKEVMETTEAMKEWQIGLHGSHVHLVDVAWVLGKQLGLKVDLDPPSEHAMQILNRVDRVYQQKPPKLDMSPGKALKT